MLAPSLRTGTGSTIVFDALPPHLDSFSRKILLAIDKLSDGGPVGGPAQQLWTVTSEADKLKLIADLKHAFTRLDLNTDGILSQAELAQSFMAMGFTAEESIPKVGSLCGLAQALALCAPCSTGHEHHNVFAVSVMIVASVKATLRLPFTSYMCP